MSIPSATPIRVLYSFPHKLGSGRICDIAWHQINGLVAAGADVTACCGALAKPVPDGVVVETTLARGKLRIPYKLLGRMRACALHDYLVSRTIEKLAGKIDVIHTWPFRDCECCLLACALFEKASTMLSKLGCARLRAAKARFRSLARFCPLTAKSSLRCWPTRACASSGIATTCRYSCAMRTFSFSPAWRRVPPSSAVTRSEQDAFRSCRICPAEFASTT